MTWVPATGRNGIGFLRLLSGDPPMRISFLWLLRKAHTSSVLAARHKAHSFAIHFS